MDLKAKRCVQTFRLPSLATENVDRLKLSTEKKNKGKKLKLERLDEAGWYFLGQGMFRGSLGGGNPQGLGGRDHSVSFSRLFILSFILFLFLFFVVMRLI